MRKELNRLELKYTNQDGRSVLLRQMKPFFIRHLDGAGQIKQSINTFHAPLQDGEFYISSTIDMRNITIEGNIIAASAEDSFKFRKELLRVFSPKQQGSLVYRDLQIACFVEEISFVVSNLSRAPAFFISLLCPSPFFETLNQINVELAYWKPNFIFPLEIIPPGKELGIREPSQIITLDNIGDIPCGCEIIFKASGSLSNPELRNMDTGEYIKINSSLESGDEIHVYTHFAGKRVIKLSGNSQSDAFSLLDIGSTFIQLRQGENTFRYDADGSIDLLELSILYRPQFLGI